MTTQSDKETIERAKRYPYEVPERSFVQVGDHRFELEHLDADNIGASRIRLNGKDSTLRECSQELTGAEFGGRTRLLAYGSNASPEVLTRKLESVEGNAMVPAVRGRLKDFDIVYSSHISAYGAVPAALQRSLGTEAVVFALYVTDEQMKEMRWTEPNYELAILRGVSCSLENGERLREVTTYISRHGCLCVEGLEVALSEVVADHRRFPAMAQEDILEHVRTSLRHDKGLDDFILENASDPGLAGRRTRALKKTASQLDWTHWSPAPESLLWLEWRGRYRVGLTPDEEETGTGYLAVVDETIRKDLKRDRHAVITREVDSGESPPMDRRAPVLRVRCRVKVPKDDAPDSSTVLLDQTARNALGIPFGADLDRFSIDVGRVSRPWYRRLGEAIGDRALGRRVLFMRVCRADPADMEKRLARIPADSIQLLGASPGGKIVITHPVQPEGQKKFEEEKLSLQAFPLTEEIVTRRRENERPGLYERYPSVGELLGVSPDLGTIYLDSEGRSKLGAEPLEVVRVRRDDLNAFLQRIRLFGLAVVGGAIGVVNVFGIEQNFANGWKVLAGAVLAALAITFINIRASASSAGQ